jgi:hypothetical protein
VNLTTTDALAVPTFVMLAELDNATRNAAVEEVFAGNRSRGGLWSLAVEPDARHEQASARGNSAATGWLSNQASLSIAAWADYTGDRAAASWLLNEAAAGSWQVLGTPVSGGGGGGKGGDS